MTRKRVSIQSLKARIETLSRRHRELDRRIEKEQRNAWPDTGQIRMLKREKLGLRDAIRMTQTLILRHSRKTA